MQWILAVFEAFGIVCIATVGVFVTVIIGLFMVPYIGPFLMGTLEWAGALVAAVIVLQVLIAIEKRREKLGKGKR